MSFRTTEDEGEISKVVRRAGRWSIPSTGPLRWIDAVLYSFKT
ncbi:hypothetical protein BH11PSE5_BH11PSE5_08620 [soil metagenome]